jgi:hypothetical protein
VRIASSRTISSRDTAAPDLLAAGFELRLDQGHQEAALPQVGQQRRHHQAQGDEGDVHGHQVDFERQTAGAEIAGVDSLHHHHPGVLAQPPVELGATDVEAPRPGSRRRREHIGEATGRGADVEAAPPLRRQSERLERRGN